MLEFYTPFRSKVRALKSPVSKDFNIQEWIDAAAANTQPTNSDYDLLAAARWYSFEARTLRDGDFKKEVASVGPNLFSVLALAAGNLEFRKADGAMEAVINAAEANGNRDLDHILEGPLSIAQEGNITNANGLMEAITDAVQSWLFDAGSLDEAGGSIPDDLERLTTRMMSVYSIQSGLNSHWNLVFWENWRLSTLDGVTHLTPADKDFELLRFAWLRREQSNQNGAIQLAAANWKNMSKAERRLTRPFQFEIDIIRSGKKRFFKVRKNSDAPRRVPIYFLARSVLERSYLADFMDMALPRLNWLTADMLLRAWSILVLLARTLNDHLKTDGPFSEELIRGAALEVSRQELRYVLRHALVLAVDRIDPLIEFLTYNSATYPKGNRGLYAAPLVALKNADAYALPLFALGPASPMRMVEGWLERGGLDDSQLTGRGTLYERALRDELRIALDDNPLLSRSKCLPTSISRKDVFGEEIDLLIRLGDILIVGDIKCFLSPADPFEIFNHLQKLAKAANQVTRKAASVRENRQAISDKFAISLAEAEQLEVIPVVVVNNGFGFSMNIDGTLITVSDFLRTYLSGGRMSMGGTLDSRNGNMIPDILELYRDETEAATKFRSTMMKPPVLTRHLNRLGWRLSGFPTHNGSQMLYDTIEYRDISEGERIKVQARVEYLDRLAKRRH